MGNDERRKLIYELLLEVKGIEEQSNQLRNRGRAFR